MLDTYICYQNKFQHNYILQITFHVVKQSYARVASKIFFTRYSIIYLPIFVLYQICFIS